MGIRMIDAGDFDGASLGKGAKYVCMCCGAPKKNEDPGVIELARDDWHDYDICVRCAVDIGVLVGMVTNEKADELRKKNRKLGSAIKAKDERIDALSKTVSSFLGPEEEK